MARRAAAERLAQRPLLARAVSLLQAGDTAGAEAVLQAVLQCWPGQGDALHFMGLLRHRQGHSQAALELLQQAVQALPQEAGPCNNLGNVLSALRRFVGLPGLCAPGNPVYWANGMHAPNEHIRLADLDEAVRFNCHMFQALGA